MGKLAGGPDVEIVCNRRVLPNELRCESRVR